MSKEDADEISRILEAADEPAEPEKKIVISMDDLMGALKTFLESIGCTNIEIR